MCPYCSAAQERIVKRGSFARKLGRSAKIQRFSCQNCFKSFCSRTGSPTFRERKSHLNQRIFRMLAAGMSQREVARQVAVRPKTVAAKLVRLGTQAQQVETKKRRGLIAKTIIFDEMETFEHSKMKPLSIAVAVEEGSRRIIAANVARMPAKGLLAARSRKKYGRRQDARPAALRDLLRVAKGVGGEHVTLKSDESPRYPKYVAEILPHASHLRFKGRRGCVVGQGELKAGGFDPLFDLNHSCASIRDRVKRLSRRTWCTTKRPDRLQSLLNLQVYFHNQRLLAPCGRPVLPMVRTL